MLEMARVAKDAGLGNTFRDIVSLGRINTLVC